MKHLTGFNENTNWNNLNQDDLIYFLLYLQNIDSKANY
jgi:hypothetical protein